jgi:ABC-type nitrate/sulfonate/bicarbonate transport system substrate-binding protein
MSNKLFAWTLFFVCSVVVAASLVGCEKKRDSTRSSPPPANSTEVVTIRVGYRPGAMLDVTPIVMAEGLVKSDVLSIELVPCSSAQVGFAKFKANEVDVLAGLALEAILSNIGDFAEGPPYRIYALQADAVELGWAAVVAAKDTKAESLRQLADHEVAVIPTKQGEYLFRRVLLAAGVPESRIKTKPYSLANPLSSITPGNSAALFGPDPAIAQAVASGCRIIERGTLSRYLAGGKPFPVAGSVISTDFIRAHPSAATAFRKLVEEAVVIVSTKPDTVRAQFRMSAYGGFAPEVCDLLVFPLMERPSPSLRQVTNILLSDLYRDGQLARELTIEPFLVE